jgi:surface antigen
MKTSQKLIATFLLGTLAIAGCMPNSGSNQTAGSLLGGAGGAVLGSQFGKGKGQLVGVAIGALAGSYLGGNIGAQMDARDRQLAHQSMQHSLEKMPDNRPSSWNNPNNQHHGQFTVKRTEEIPARDMVCRDYEHRVFIGPREETVVGRACRNVHDRRAQWRVVDY